MTNPFDERSDQETGDRELATAAVAGDRAALETLVYRHQAWIYNIALRMVWEPHDAEDVTQEVLVKVITKLSTYRGDAEFRTWLYRIVANHVLNMKRRGAERNAVTFGQFAQGLRDAPDAELPDPRTIPVDQPVLVEEAKLGCTMAMLTCLDRRQRLVYVLGELFEASHTVGAAVLDTTPANFRQMLARARRDLHRFMAGTCGLVDPANPCRCPKKTRAFIAAGYVDPEHLRFATRFQSRIHDVAPKVSRVLEDAMEEHARQVQAEQPFLDPPDMAGMLARALARPDVRSALRLDHPDAE